MAENSELRRTAPYVIIFYEDGPVLRARIRDPESQEVWIVYDAGALHELLAREMHKHATS